VIASKGGSPENPDWYENLEATHDAVIQIKERRIPVSARTAHGEERARLWEWMAEVWPDYRAYQARTEREIPVVVFEAG
jgi:proline iminopeptidase